MRVTLKLFASLREFGPPVREIDLAEGATVCDVVATAGIPDGTAVIRLVNGEFAEPGRVLRSADVVALFSPVAGG